MGDFLIVGLLVDQVSHSFLVDLFHYYCRQVVNRYKGGNYPIMNLQERVLNVLACKVSSANTYYRRHLAILCNS